MTSDRGRTAGQVSFWTSVLAMAVMASSAAAASAQTADPMTVGSWQISAFGGGWNSLSAPYVYKTPSSTAVVGFGNAPAFGLAVGVNATCLLGLELSWTQTNPAQQYATSPPTPIRNVIMNIFELDSLWYFHRGTFQAYGTVGLGGANTGSSFGGANFMAVVGLGVKAFVSPHFAVRADVRWQNMYGNVGHAGDPAFCDSAGCYFYRGSWYSSLPVTAGVTYAF
jgi:outer membrane protein W